MGDEAFVHPLCLRWKDGPESLKKLKNKLLLYLQSRSKSDGGDCEIRDIDCSRGHVLIHFKEEEARDRILRKESHVLKLPNGKELPLSLTLPNIGGPDGPRGALGSAKGLASGEDKASADDEEPPASASSSRVLIRNVRDTFSDDMLTLLVENISEKTDDADFSVERIPEIRSAVVTFTCDIDVAAFIAAFSGSLRVLHHKLEARALEESRSVRVENLPEDAAEMHLEAFFESSNQRGGKVKEIVMLAEERAALITFHETSVVRRVVTKEHVFAKTRIAAFPYYPLLDLTLYGKRGPCIEIPKPIDFPISPYILQFICNNEGLKNNIEEKMKIKHCEIQWPDPECPNPVLHLLFPPALTTHLRSAAKIVPKWNEEVFNEFSVFISKFRVMEYDVDSSVWEAMVEDVGSPAYDGVLIKADFGSEKVFLAGTSKEVTRVDPRFGELVKRTAKEVDRKKQTKIEMLAMSQSFYQIMCKSGIKTKILEQVPELKIDYDIPSKRARLSGLREEVLTAKCEILSAKQQLKSKLIPTNPHLVRFLKSTDNEDLSCLLFLRHNINALLEIDDGAVRLMACSGEELTAAEKQMKEKLLHRQVLVEDKSLLRSPEWRSLHSRLMQSFNAENIAVRVDESSSGTEDNVVIAGLSSEVLKCYQQVGDFLEQNTTVESEVAVQSAAVMKFVWEERKENIETMKRNVNVTKNLNNICLSGPRLKVREAENALRDVLRRLHRDTLRIDKPGAKKFCKTNEEAHVIYAKTNFRCVIQLEEVGAEGNAFGKPQFQKVLPNGLTLCVYKEDLCRHNVDVIVNAANEDLKHIGGLAKAILNTAGRKLQEDSDQIVRRDGKLNTGDAVVTDAGKLPCKQVIHAVGPRWESNSKTRCERLLRRAITTSLQLASEKNHASIAIPAVSSGVFGFPLKLCVENIVEAIRDYAEAPGQRNTLQRIHLVDVNDQTVSVFSEVAKAKFGNQTAGAASDPATRSQPSTSQAEERASRGKDDESRGKDDAVMTKEGLTIRLVQKNIEDCSTDVVVNSTGASLDLNVGAVSKALLNRAGFNMQQLLNDACQGTSVANGSVFSTSGCNLKCLEVLHVVTPPWDNGLGTSEQVLRTMIAKCLALAEQKQWQSISFPAIGTGNLGYPKVLVASVMFDEIFQFSCKNRLQNLQEVHLVLHPRDQDTIQAFTTQLANCTDDGVGGATKRQPAATESTFFGTVTNPSLGVHEMKIGSVTYQVKTGDITKEASEIIVNSSNDNFSLYAGVSKAILDAAGQNVISSAAVLGSQPHKGHVITGPGNLSQCKWILHVAGPKQPASIKKIVLDVLQECEAHRATSVTFPAIGTGAGKMAASTVADSILDGLVDFLKSKSARSLQTVKVVLFQQQMLNDFYMSMKKREGTAQPGAKSILTRITEFFIPPKASKPAQKLTAFQLVDGIEPVMFSLCAADQISVSRTKEWLLKQIEDEQAERIIKEECISELEEAELRKISDLQKKFQVSVIYKPPDPSIRIVGLTRDVLAASAEIDAIVSRVKDAKTKEKAAEITSNLVEWRYENGGSMVAFDKMTNLKLEEAKNDKKVQIQVKIRGTEYTARIQAEIATDTSGSQIQIQRVVKNEGDSLRLPSHWKAMGNALVMEEAVAPGTSEYSDVQQKFQRTCACGIQQILRVQNKTLWFNYQIKKQNIDSKNGSTNNEQELFHGTDFNSIQHVNHHGFNRSYAGRNGTAFGNGTYFAVNAQYSVGYASRDVNGQRHMYLARVLTGLYCAGQNGMIAPPAKNAANPTDLYDSVTDKVRNPSMFVIFNDVQAYPEYHIIFQ